MKRIILKRDEDYIEIGFSFPFFLKDVTGIHMADYENSMENNYSLDGISIKGSRQKERYIDITFTMDGNYTENRQRLYALLPAGALGTLYFYDEAGNVKVIDYKVESIDIPAMGKLREGTISLICENPFFRDVNSTYYNMAQWVGGLEFDVELSDANELDKRQAERIKVLSNPSNVNIPLKITFRATGNVVNPILQNLTTDETLQIDTSMTGGDTIVIDTRIGIRQKITKNGAPANNLWHYGSDWLNLPIGDSVFRYDADSGYEYLDVEIETTTLYRGA